MDMSLWVIRVVSLGLAESDQRLVYRNTDDGKA